MALDFPNSPTSSQTYQTWIWDGAKWEANANPAGGTVTSITAGTGLTGGVISTAGTIALQVPVTMANGGTGRTSFTPVPTNNLSLAEPILMAGSSAIDDFSATLGYIATSAVVASYPPIFGMVGAGGPIFVIASSNGSAGSPTPTTASQVLGQISFDGYDPTNQYQPGVVVQAVTTQAWSAGHGTQLQFQIAPNNATSANLSNSVVFMQNASVALNNASITGTTLYMNSSGYNITNLAPASNAQGPWHYADNTNQIFKLGPNSNPSFIFQDGSGNAIGTFNAGNLRLSGNFLNFLNTTPAVNGVGGPNIYVDNTSFLLKTGTSGSNGLMLQNYSGGNFFMFTPNDLGSSTASANLAPAMWRFRQNAGADDTAGATISYRVYDTSALCIVGAGVGPNRTVHLWDNVIVDGNLTVSPSSGLMMAASGGIGSAGISASAGSLRLGDGRGGPVPSVIVDAPTLISGPRLVLGGMQLDYDSLTEVFSTSSLSKLEIKADETHLIGANLRVDKDLAVLGQGVSYGGQNFYALEWARAPGSFLSVRINDGAIDFPVGHASDARMKFKIEASTYDCLPTILAMPLHSFKWKGSQGEEDKDAPTVSLGLVAQEVYKLFPDGANVGDGVGDKLGNIWTINTTSLIALLFGGLKQLYGEIEKLRNGLAAQGAAIRSMNGGSNDD